MSLYAWRGSGEWGGCHGNDVVMICASSRTCKLSHYEPLL